MKCQFLFGQFGILLGSVLLAGCGGSDPPVPLGQVSGVISLDGKPFGGALIEFNPVDRPASSGADSPVVSGSSAVSDPEGRYVLKFNDEHDGATLGSHTVRVTEIQEALPEDGPPKPLRIPLLYTISSPLRFDVQEGSNVFDIELKSK